jgi:hypothetical protein
MTTPWTIDQLYAQFQINKIDLEHSWPKVDSDGNVEPDWVEAFATDLSVHQFDDAYNHLWQEIFKPISDVLVLENQTFGLFLKDKPECGTADVEVNVEAFVSKLMDELKRSSNVESPMTVPRHAFKVILPITDVDQKDHKDFVFHALAAQMAGAIMEEKGAEYVMDLVKRNPVITYGAKEMIETLVPELDTKDTTVMVHLHGVDPEDASPCIKLVRRIPDNPRFRERPGPRFFFIVSGDKALDTLLLVRKEPLLTDTVCKMVVMSDIKLF